MSDFIKVHNSQCGCTNCNENEKYLLIKNHLSEFNTELAKAEARLNLGIPDEWNLKWGNITGFIENQVDLTEYLDNYTQIFKETIWDSFNSLKKDLLDRIQLQLDLVEESRQIVVSLISLFEQLETDLRELITSLTTEIRTNFTNLTNEIHTDFSTLSNKVLNDFAKLEEDIKDDVNSKIPYTEWDNLVNVNNHIGGYYLVTTLEEMNNISDKFKKVGMLCYVKEDPNKIYTYLWDGTNWIKSKIGGGIEVVNTFNELSTIAQLDIGLLAYITNEDNVVVYSESGWRYLDRWVISENEPNDKGTLWIDPTNDAALNEEGNLTVVRNLLRTLEAQVSLLMTLLNYGIIAGDSSIGARILMMSSEGEYINPDTGEAEEGIEPDTTNATYTVPNISIKLDTSENFQNNKNNLISGELIWLTDKDSLYIYLIKNGNTLFIPIGSSSGDTIIGGDDMTQEDIEKMYFNHLGFVDSSGKQWYLTVNEKGVVSIYDSAVLYPGRVLTYGSYVNDYLRINSIFLGGKNTALDSFSACSHNFVELANASTTDINLNGIYLLYRRPGEQVWESLPLKGTIKAGSTFLIIGDRCSYSSNVTLDVVSPDMIWKDSKGNPIQFEYGGGCFYLVCSQDGLFHDKSDWTSLTAIGTLQPWEATVTPVGYIDLVGILITQHTSYPVHSEGNSTVTITTNENVKDCIFVRSFTLDPCSLALKKHSDKKSSALWTHINMSTTSTDAYPYYNMFDKHNFVPKNSSSSKDIFDTRSTFSHEKPNMVNITFGIQATDNGSGATRCFNWVSTGYYDEYLEYRKVGNSSFTTKKSISLDNYSTEYSGDSNVAKFIKLYNRIKWLSTNLTPVTTHKVILRNLTAGTYEYRIRRTNDNTYMSDLMYFTVRTDDTVNSAFEFVHTSDLQAFNYYEYQAWTKACWAINKNHPNIHFTINTGDATLNGNRESEWIDYYEGRKHLRNKEEMYTIGNNDLCGIIPYELGDGTADTYKINHKNFSYYYMIELDENNPSIFTYIDTAGIDDSLLGDVLEYTANSFSYYLPSLYSFNYGNYHFIALNSEIASNTGNVYYTGNNSFMAHAYYSQYKWLERDIELYSSKNYIAFMHEIPFCIIVKDQYNIAIPRTADNGSKLNKDFSLGVSKSEETDTSKYIGGGCYSEFFLNNNIKLVLGGHKHTYSLSYPTKENVTYSNGIRTVDLANPIIDTTGGDGVVYEMTQATGYKLVSNKELPGQNIAWLRKYFPVSNTGAASTSQYYPMYSLMSITNNSINLSSYVVYNIYKEDGSKITSFNINNLYPNFETQNSTNINFGTVSNPINNIIINY